MAYLNLDLDYFTHPKTLRLMSVLGGAASIYPVKLWCYVGRYHVDGKLPQYTEHELENIVGWDGEQGKLISELLRLKFLDQTSDGYKIHDWCDHSRHLEVFKKRAKSAAKKRWDNYASSIAQAQLKQSQDAASAMREGCSYPNLTKPLLTKPNQAKPTEENPPPAAATLPPPGGLVEVPKVVRVQMQDLVALWNQIPGVSPMRETTGAVKVRLAARLKEYPDMEWWKTLFARVQQSDFLCGRKTDFAASLDWVLGPKNLAKLKAGNYDNRQSANGYDSLREAFVNA